MGHISADARAAFSQILVKTVRELLSRSPEDRCDVSPPADIAATLVSEDTLLVFTISSFRFRMLVIFSLPTDPGQRAYFTPQGGGATFEEVFAELGNLCCGAINRELSTHFPHLGMSTPSVLPGPCLGFIDALAPEFGVRHLVTINDQIHIPVTLALCGYAPIDFTLDGAAAHTPTGELEMF